MYRVACQGQLYLEKKKVKVCTLRSTITLLIDGDRMEKNAYSCVLFC
jgi:hypothetical protein